MHTIQSTQHGRHHERVSGEPLTSDETSLEKTIERAWNLVRQEQQRRGTGLPDGCRILNERGQQVHAEWLGLP